MFLSINQEWSPTTIEMSSLLHGAASLIYPVLQSSLAL